MPVRMKWTLVLLIGTCLYVIAAAEKVGSKPAAFVDERPVTVEAVRADAARRPGRLSATEENQALTDEKGPVARPIAQISGFEGEVVVQSGTKILRFAQAGLRLDNGDRIQTGQGEVQVLFNDGAVMKIRPFSSAMIQERDEKTGFQIFKTRKEVRRITCFTGKLRFKSGASKRRNYLQTPNAVCELRGSEGDLGYDHTNTLLNMHTGEADILGKVIRGFFADPGMMAATKSRVYRALTRAHETTERAKETGKSVDLAKARVAALRVIREAATALQRNPDRNIAREAKVAANVADANIAAGDADVAVEQLLEAGAPARDIERARAAANRAQAQATATHEVADDLYLEGVLEPGRLDEVIKKTETLAELAQVAAREAISIWAKVAPPEEIPLEEELAEEESLEEAAFEVPPEVPFVAPPPYTETTEQEVYQRESSASQ